MSVTDSLEKKAGLLTGAVVTDAQITVLQGALSSHVLPDWYLLLLKTFPLCGTCFSLEDEEDLSEMGVEVMWFTPEQIVDEALNAYPGKKVVDLGYLPVGACLTGSGDPYFLRIKGGSVNPSLVRIPHDAPPDEDYPEGQIEIVTTSLSDFFDYAEFDYAEIE